MKKKTILWMVIPLIVAGVLIFNWNYISQSFEWKMNWGFEAPRPSKIETIFNTRSGFPNEGQSFHILEYGTIEKKLKKNNDWIPIDEESFDTVSSYLNEFQKDTARINMDTQNLTSLFQENPVTYDHKDKYFYKLKEDNSYILAISNAKEQRLYVMEWIQ